MKRLWLIVLVLFFLAVIIVGAQRARKPLAVEVTVAQATAGDFVREVSGTGNVEARTYTLSFSRTGRIARVPVHEGEHVRAGAVLAELSTAPEVEDVQATREKLQALTVSLTAQQQEALADLQQRDLQLADTRRKLALTRRLFDAGAASRDEVDTLERQRVTQTGDRAAQAARALSNHRDLLAQLTGLRTQIQTSERVLRESHLTAPVSGSISQVDLRVGETAQGTMKLVEDHSLQVKVRMAEADTVGVRVGQAARVELDADPEQPLDARVERLGISADIQGQGASAILPVTLRFTDARAGELARPGFTATGRITTLRLARAVQVPVEALVEPHDPGQKHAYLWVVDKKTLTATRKEVHITARNLTAAAVQGVAADATVITLPPDTLKSGDKVRIKPETK